ncbi:MAG: hypothetical protein IH840_12490 [Candidatus Heimdallarchaeota archaeon]|nr:hypothetical protein [Candidatus Heimdallarchaeota archaeon]
MMKSLIHATERDLSQIYFLIDEAHNLSSTKTVTFMKKDLEFVTKFLGELTVLRRMREAMKTNEKLYPQMLGDDEEWNAIRTVLNESDHKIRKKFNLSLWDMSKPEFQALNSFIMARFNGNIISYHDRLEILQATPALILDEINDAKLQIYQSGTFNPIDHYKKLFGLSRGKTLVTQPDGTYNQFRAYMSSELTSLKRRRTPKMFKSMAITIKEIYLVSPRHVLVIWPSYDYIAKLKEQLDKLFEDGILISEEHKSNLDLLSNLIRYKTIPLVFVAVSSGKISEGVEIVVDGISLLSTVIFAGLPIAPPTKDQTIVRRARMHASQDPRAAQNFMVTIPLERAVKQAYGRTIRAMHDRGALILLDFRAERYLKKILKLKKYRRLKTLKSDLTEFFAGYDNLEQLRLSSQ